MIRTITADNIITENNLRRRRARYRRRPEGLKHGTRARVTNDAALTRPENIFSKTRADLRK